MNDNDKKNPILDFWNARAELGFSAGTNDIIIKQLEMEVLIKYIKPGMRILDFGCGNGVTAMEIAKRFDVSIVGMDFSPAMIASAKTSCCAAGLSDKIRFLVGDDESVCQLNDRFDLIYSERALINLPTWERQEQAISNLVALLNENGLYLMCECSLDGLNEINRFRKHLNLSEIVSPWHNKYFADDEIKALDLDNVKLVKIENFSSTYYFLSRVVNAALAMNSGMEPDYNAEINRLALTLPAFGELSQSKLYIFSRGGGDAKHRTVYKIEFAVSADKAAWYFAGRGYIYAVVIFSFRKVRI